MLTYVLVLVTGKFHFLNLHQIFDFYPFSKSSLNSYKFAAINFETEIVENYDNGMLIFKANEVQLKNFLFERLVGPY